VPQPIILFANRNKRDDFYLLRFAEVTQIVKVRPGKARGMSNLGAPDSTDVLARKHAQPGSQWTWFTMNLVHN